MNTRVFLTIAIVSLMTPALAYSQPAKLELHARVTGYVEKVHVKADTKVKKGEVLFELDSRPYKAALELANARVLQAEARLQRTRADLDRIKALRQSNAVSQAELEQSVANHTEAEVGVAIARIEREKPRTQLEFTQIRAPFDGNVGALQTSVGTLVKADDTVLLTLTAQDATQPQKAPGQIKELQKERLAVLKRIVELRDAQVKAGLMQPHAVLQAQRAVLEASLELAETQAERLELLRKDLKIVQEIHKVANVSFKAGRMSEVEMLNAQTAVLDAHIRLAREESKVKTSK